MPCCPHGLEHYVALELMIVGALIFAYTLYRYRALAGFD